jgi:hypothetical protein
VFCRSIEGENLSELACDLYLDAFSTAPLQFNRIYDSRNQGMIFAVTKKFGFKLSDLQKLSEMERKKALLSKESEEGKHLSENQINLLLADLRLQDRRNFWRNNDAAKVTVIEAVRMSDSFIMRKSENTAWGACLFSREWVSPLASCDPFLKDLAAAHYEGFKAYFSICGDDFPRECLFKNPL